jgi:hypothetical protein
MSFRFSNTHSSSADAEFAVTARSMGDSEKTLSRREQPIIAGEQLIAVAARCRLLQVVGAIAGARQTGHRDPASGRQFPATQFYIFSLTPDPISHQLTG